MSLQSRTPVLALAVTALLCAQAAMAQAQTVPAASGTSPVPADVNGSTTFQTGNGTIVTVRSHQPTSRQVAPAPAFASLDVNGNGAVDPSEAASYPPLANDFQYADGNRSGSVSKSEYARWVKQP